MHCMSFISNNDQLNNIYHYFWRNFKKISLLFNNICALLTVIVILIASSKARKAVSNLFDVASLLYLSNRYLLRTKLKTLSLDSFLGHSVYDFKM